MDWCGAGRLVDVAPTVLALLGVELAGAMDGGSLASTVEDASERDSIAAETQSRSVNVETEEGR